MLHNGRPRRILPIVAVTVSCVERVVSTRPDAVGALENQCRDDSVDVPRGGRPGTRARKDSLAKPRLATGLQPTLYQPDDPADTATFRAAAVRDAQRQVRQVRTDVLSADVIEATITRAIEIYRSERDATWRA
jgi:hypothetical protein